MKYKSKQNPLQQLVALYL